MAKGKTRKLAAIDTDTGEILEEGIPVWVKAKVTWHEDWIMAFQHSLREISRDKELTGEMLRVWMNLLGRLGFENWIFLEQKLIAEDLDIKKPNVSRAIRNLVKKGLLIRGPRLGRSYAYKLNSQYVWKGKVKNLSKDRMNNVKDFFTEAAKLRDK